MKAGMSEGAIPAKLSEIPLAMVTAGFGKDLEEVNQQLSDIKPDRHGKCSGAERYANEDCTNQAESGDEFTDPLAKPAAHGCRGVNQGMIKHHMRSKYTQNSANNLAA